MEDDERALLSLSPEFVRPLLVYRFWIVLAVFVFAAAVVAQRLVSEQEYTATLVVAPTDRAQNASSKLSQLAGLASFAGVNFPGANSVSDFDRFLYLVHSADLADWQLRYRNVLPILYPDRWDPATRKLGPSTSVLSRFSSWLTGPRDVPQPDAYAIARQYDSHLSEQRVLSLSDVNQQSDLLQLTYTDTDPVRATTILNRIVDDANEILRERAFQRASIQAAYLQEKLRDVSFLEYRNTLERLYSEQEQILMLTHSNLPFAAEPVSGVNVPAMKVPKRVATFGLIAAAIGFSLSYFVAIVAYNLGGGRSRRFKSVSVAQKIRAWIGAERPVN